MKSRNLRLLLPAFLLLLATTPTFPDTGPSVWGNRPLVHTVYGLLLGRADGGKTWCWRGVPYARPPVGPLRWKAPADPEPWEGIRKARRFGPHASQILPVLGEIGSEDCLYLNIWRPRTRETGLPVYVFIHGGGNSIGSGSSPGYQGQEVAGRSRMVYLTLNYRLGVMGWFRYPGFNSGGTPEDRSGNYGTLDLIQALHWIHENIAAFGGDPGNVTIAGESGGAMDVMSLLTSPEAKGLFHHAVSESGLAVMRTPHEAELASRSLLKRLMVSDGKAADTLEAEKLIAEMPVSDIEAYFRSKTPHELMKQVPTMVGGMAWWPNVYADGTVLPKAGYAVFADGSWANKIPLLIGVNHDEAKLFRLLLRNPKPGSGDYQMMSRYESLLWRIRGLDTLATAIASHAGAPPVYAYRFDWGKVEADGTSVLPGDRGAIVGACHASEIPFFLGKRTNELALITGNTFTRANRPGRIKLTNLCLNYLANFARTGNPNAQGLPEWPTWENGPAKKKLIILDAGFNDLRITYGTDQLTFTDLIGKVRAELTGRERERVLKSLNAMSIFRPEDKR
jgi:para-nitrobenzyl esterase